MDLRDELQSALGSAASRRGRWRSWIRPPARRRRGPGAPTWRPTGAGGAQCGAVIEALLATARHDAGARARVGALDSMLRVHPAGMDTWENLLVSQLLVAPGDTARALAAVRHRIRALSDIGWYLSTYLREEGRRGPVRAWSRYLAMRAGTEPALRPEVDSVKAELARLVGEPR